MANGLMPNPRAAPGGIPPGGVAPSTGGGASMGAPPPPATMQNGQGSERRATEEEKELFNSVLANSMSAIYSEKTVDALGETLHAAHQAGNPGAAVEPIAQAVSNAVAVVAYDGVANGLPIEREMVALAAATLAHDVGRSLAEAAGVPPLSDEQVQAVYLRATELLADRKEEGMGVQAAGQGRPEPAPGNGLMQARPNRRARRAAAADQRRQAGRPSRPSA